MDHGETPESTESFWAGLEPEGRTVIKVGGGLAALAICIWLFAFPHTRNFWENVEIAVVVLAFLGLFVLYEWIKSSRQRTRLALWKLLTTGLWLLGALSIYLVDGDNIRATYNLGKLLVEDKVAQSRLGEILTTFFADGYDDPKSAIFFHSWMALWVAITLLALLKFGNRPGRWSEFGKFRWAFLCILACVGYPGAATIYGVFDALPPGLKTTTLRVLAAPILLPLVGFATVISLGLALLIATWVFRLVLVSIPIKVFDYLHEQDVKAHIRRQKQQGLASYVTRFDYWLRGVPLPDVPDDSKGARFATDREVKELWDPNGMGFGHYAGGPLRLETDKHVLIMASTRSGKGVTLIIPHLLRYPGSVFVLDPKGENSRATGRQRTRLNDSVHFLDPFGITGLPRSRFNPLAHFKPETMEAQSKALAAALVIGAQRDHWTASAQQLLATLILYVVATPQLDPAKKDLVAVRKMLLGVIKPALEDMRKTDLADGLIADLAASFLNTPERELGSIISTAQRETEILDNPAIAACLSASGPGSEIDFAHWHRGTMSVFLCLSAPKFPTFNRWLRLVLTAALDEMTDRLNPPKLPVCFMLDELATLGHLEVIENAIGLAAGYGVTLISVFQDVAQMRDLYKGRWASFIGNSGVRALFSLDDFETADYWSKFIGSRLTPTSNEQRNIWGLGTGSSAGEAVRPFMSPEEIMLRYAQDKMLVLKQGSRPVEADRIPYYKDPSLAGLWDDPRMR